MQPWLVVVAGSDSDCSRASPRSSRAGPAAANTTPQALPFTQDWTNTGLITVDDNWAARARHRRLPRRRRSPPRPAVDPQTVRRRRITPRRRRDREPDQPRHVHDRRRRRVRRSPTRSSRSRARAPRARRTSSSTSTPPGSRPSPSPTTCATSTAPPTTPCSRSPCSTASARAAPSPTSRRASSPTRRPGPSLATLVTPVSVAAAGRGGQPAASSRSAIITTDAVGNDEWVGVDDISVTGVGDRPRARRRSPPRPPTARPASPLDVEPRP